MNEKIKNEINNIINKNIDDIKKINKENIIKEYFEAISLIKILNNEYNYNYNSLEAIIGGFNINSDLFQWIEERDELQAEIDDIHYDDDDDDDDKNKKDDDKKAKKNELQFLNNDISNEMSRLAREKMMTDYNATRIIERCGQAHYIKTLLLKKKRSLSESQKIEKANIENSIFDIKVELDNLNINLKAISNRISEALIDDDFNKAKALNLEKKEPQAKADKLEIKLFNLNEKLEAIQPQDDDDEAFLKKIYNYPNKANNDYDYKKMSALFFFPEAENMKADKK